MIVYAAKLHEKKGVLKDYKIKEVRIAALISEQRE